MGRVYQSGTDIVVEGTGAQTVWSTALPVGNILPQANWLQIPLTVTFPDFVKRNAYAFDIATQALTGLTVTSCASWSTLLPGEWGPDQTAPRNLPDIVLGIVPAGVDFIDVRVTLARTKAPTNYLAFAIKNNIPPNETPLPGGSCIAEETSAWTRIFSIEISGTSVILRRRQSVYSGSNGISWVPGNAVYYPNGGKHEGWTYGGGSGADTAQIAQLIQGKSGGNINKERGASNACSLTDTTDFSSTWTGTAVIRPGFLRVS